MKDKNKKWLKIAQTGVVMVIALLVIFECKKDVAIPQNTQNNQNLTPTNSNPTKVPIDSLILGNWEWVYSITSWSQNTLTPFTVGYNYHLRIKNDTIFLLKNNNTDGIMLYSLGYVKFITNSSTTYDSLPYLSTTVLVQSTAQNIIGHRIVKLNQDTLLFDDKWVDGNEILYRREN